MDCPRDPTSLVRLDIDGLSLDTCPTCRGLWFDSDELRRAKDRADPDLDWMDFEIWKHDERFEIEPHEDLCPRCVKPMVRLRYGDTDVQIDFCTACRGVWLDAHELEGIIHALKDEASRKPASAYFLRTLKEALDILKSPRQVASEWRDFKHVYNLLKLRFFVERPTLMKAIVEAQESGPF